MQLKNTTIKDTLYTASCSLLASAAIADDWDFDTAIMYYGETDRVQAVEGIVQAKKTLRNDREFNTKLVIDSLTGSSANGAVPQQNPQTFTSPSGNGQYQTSTHATPLDSTFLDTRAQLAAQWSAPLAENYVYAAGTNLSREYDYRSVAFNGSIGRYLNAKNTTLSLGISYAFDFLRPVGGQPIPLSTMVVDRGQFADDAEFNSAFNATRQSGGDDNKKTFDLIFGLTQVINRRWISQFNLSVSEVDGYLTDPYKIVSVVNNAGTATVQRYENRPDSRTKQAFYAQSKYHFGHSVWDISYRFTNDDWGIQSHTVESRYRFLFSNSFLLGKNGYLEPHIRFYQQKGAEFYQAFLREGEALPEHVSADYRIGELNTYTVGIKYGKKLSREREYGVRLEYYKQAPQDNGVEKPGQLNELELFPNLDAMILQLDYKF